MVGEDTKFAPEVQELTDTVTDTSETVTDNVDAEDGATDKESVTEDGASTPADAEPDCVDYAEIARADMEALRLEFPELREKSSITELKNPLRYAALRDLGLTPREAYLATSAPAVRYDNRSHLRSSVPSGARESTDRLGATELEAARELFSGLSDRELQKLYKKVIR